jgi:hypothetical protein
MYTSSFDGSTHLMQSMKLIFAFSVLAFFAATSLAYALSCTHASFFSALVAWRRLRHVYAFCDMGMILVATFYCLRMTSIFIPHRIPHRIPNSARSSICAPCDPNCYSVAQDLKTNPCIPRYHVHIGSWGK